MKFFILVTLMGSLYSGPTMLRFDSEAECKAAKKAIKEESPFTIRHIECIPVEVENQKAPL